MTDTTTSVSNQSELPPVDERFRDPSLPVEQRVALLLAQMTLEEKIGLFFHTMITITEEGAEDIPNPFGFPGAAETEDYVTNKLMTHFNVLGAAPTAEKMAEWHNRLQDLAKTTRLGIPDTLSNDPRH